SGAPELLQPVRLPWIDSAQIGLHRAVWRTAMKVDALFGPVEDGFDYARTSGSIAPALLWDEYDNVRPKVRFRVDLPLPQLDQRWSAFIGRVSRDEFVTERERASGAFPRDFGDITDDQVLAGVKFRPLQNDGRFELDGGVRVRSPLDPYVKGGYRYMRALSPNTRLHLRETLFWQNSDGVGITSRADVDRILLDRWLLRWTGSGTWSQKSAGVRG